MDRLRAEIDRLVTERDDARRIVTRLQFAIDALIRVRHDALPAAARSW